MQASRFTAALAPACRATHATPRGVSAFQRHHACDILRAWAAGARGTASATLHVRSSRQSLQFDGGGGLLTTTMPASRSGVGVPLWRPTRGHASRQSGDSRCNRTRRFTSGTLPAESGDGRSRLQAPPQAGGGSRITDVAEANEIHGAGPGEPHDPPKYRVHLPEAGIELAYTDTHHPDERPSDAADAATRRARAPLGTFVFVHGVPGSSRDWRYLAPAIQRHAPRTRVIRLDLPGYGDTPLPGGDQLAYVATKDVAQFVVEAFKALGIESGHATGALAVDRVHAPIVVGHSLGCHAVMASMVANPAIAGGVALLAPVSLRTHKGIRPHIMLKTVIAIADAGVPIISQAMADLIADVLPKKGFPRSTAALECVHMVRRAANIDWVEARANATGLSWLRMPTFMAWAADDPLIESELVEELHAYLPRGPRLRFASGGHNVQKTHADHIAKSLVDWAGSLERFRYLAL